ncbi:hypothetical protein LNKW23_34560 [Paralimibaculum aggregatum]|uniref:Uncharacterized protein n=1 Tax=Paralimibaculum aggregatum TaxID=3036245 RepID=A0ABQ6LM08_9RHOB|nr:hypothetical protein [Limibaculum sp. NKW23]GMG84241.1 hypothetical protein LNKW23_34560 [Limibaculum sp. NKW23]
MKAFLIAVLAMAAIAAGADYALDHYAGFSAADVASGDSVRLGN